MSQDKNNEVYNYDKIFQKYSKIFRNPKYEVYDLEKFIFLIEIKVVHSEELKPKIFDPLETIMYTLVKTQNEKTLVMAPFKIRPLFSHD
jgi:hypothetical protein